MEKDAVWAPDGKDSEERVNRVFEEWSLVFNNGAKGTGLTTPVNMKPDTYHQILHYQMDCEVGIQTNIYCVSVQIKR